jgi:superfamily II DNA/RNA helicase
MAGAAGEGSADVPPKRFEELALSSEGKAAMREGFGYQHQTPVQANTFDPILAGKDLIVRAKTGAGKTLSFLLPMAEKLSTGSVAGGLRVLVVSPVRELSMQIFAEAEKLLPFYPGTKAVCMVGGLDWKEDMHALEAVGDASIFLVVTPGRLQTHIGKTDGFATRLSQVQVLVLDEVDYLTSEIFRPATEDIVAALPVDAARQNLFFSATMSDEVSGMMKKAGKDDFLFVDMLKDGDVSVPAQIDQTYCVVPTEDMTGALWSAIEAGRSRSESPKLVVIFMTGRIAAYYAEAYRKSGTDSGCLRDPRADQEAGGQNNGLE